MFELEPPHPIVAAIRAEEEAKRRSDAQKGTILGPTGGHATSQATCGAISFKIPLHVSIAFGTPEGTQNLSGGSDPFSSSAQQPQTPLPDDSVTARPRSGPEPSEPLDSAELREALRELEDSQSRPYYDTDADRDARSEYYQNIEVDQLDGESLYRALSDLVKQTHRNKINYKPASHVYPWVDLQEVGGGLKLKSIYSGREFNAQDFIEADFRIEQERQKLREMLLRESSFSAMEQERQLNLLEASLPFNCEHVVPQSWFAKKEPMRGDLHHLFACEVGCNSFRSNIPYFDFVDSEEVVRQACGRREENKFEPTAGKGTVARATLYFLLRYPTEINQTIKEYKAERLATLIAWHRKDPVGRYELHRNAAIHEKQGNRNPLIDFPEWTDLIDFRLGLG
jgi:endonuclease I